VRVGWCRPLGVLEVLAELFELGRVEGGAQGRKDQGFLFGDVLADVVHGLSEGGQDGLRSLLWSTW
jgi:hypothetical protein